LAHVVCIVTLRDPFVGYVLPSKIHACIESGERILFVGSAEADVHLLASALPPGHYQRVDVNDVEGLVNALCAFEEAVRARPESRRDRRQRSRRAGSANLIDLRRAQTIANIICA
jgi:hypothetical protein